MQSYKELQGTTRNIKESKELDRSMLYILASPDEGEPTMHADRFLNLNNARSFAERTIKASAIVLGDDGHFWVVNLATMEKLLANGYELAR